MLCALPLPPVPPSQVSNWFANARRRLKNTVRQPDLSWALRIKLYNKYVQGNAERLSVSSDDSCSEGTGPDSAAATALILFTCSKLNKVCVAKNGEFYNPPISQLDY